MGVLKGICMCALLASFLCRESVGSVHGIELYTDVNNPNTHHDLDLSYGDHVGDSKYRLPRFAKDPWSNCSTWSTWVNDHHPSPTQKDDFEHVPFHVLQEFCPKGNVTKFECRDEKGEPFNKNVTAPDKTFYISCYDLDAGVKCTVLDPKLKYCPDMSFRYFCTCPTKTTTATTSAASTTAASTAAAVTIATSYTGSSTRTHSGVSIIQTSAVNHSITPASNTSSTTSTRPTSDLRQISSDPISTMQETGSTVGQTAYPTYTECGTKMGHLYVSCWIGVIVVAGVLFVSNIVLSVYLYKRSVNKSNKKTQRKKINPLQLV